MDWAFAVLAGGIAFGIVGLELVTAKYPRTWFCIKGSFSFWIYCLIYGVISAVVFICLNALVASDKVQLSDGVMTSPWLRAIAVGIAIKSFLHINLFNVTVNAQPFPVGVATLMELFEPHLLRTIVFDEFNAVRAYVGPTAGRYPIVAQVIQTINRNTPPSLPAPEVGAFRDELNKSADSTEAMEKALRFLGRKSFLRIFP